MFIHSQFIAGGVSKSASRQRSCISEYPQWLKKRSPQVSPCKQHIIRILSTKKQQGDPRHRAARPRSLYYSWQLNIVSQDFAVHGDRKKWRSGGSYAGLQSRSAVTINLYACNQVASAEFKSWWCHLLRKCNIVSVTSTTCLRKRLNHSYHSP